jgi:hypothetical protein
VGLALTSQTARSVDGLLQIDRLLLMRNKGQFYIFIVTENVTCICLSER